MNTVQNDPRYFTIHRLVSKWETYEDVEASTEEEALKLVREELYRDTEELDEVKQTITIKHK